MHIICGTNGAATGAATDSIPVRFSDGDGSGLGQINAGDATGAPAFAAASRRGLSHLVGGSSV